MKTHENRRAGKHGIAGRKIDCRKFHNLLNKSRYWNENGIISMEPVKY